VICTLGVVVVDVAVVVDVTVVEMQQQQFSAKSLDQIHQNLKYFN